MACILLINLQIQKTEFERSLPAISDFIFNDKDISIMSIANRLKMNFSPLTNKPAGTFVAILAGGAAALVAAPASASIVSDDTPINVGSTPIYFGDGAATLYIHNQINDDALAGKNNTSWFEISTGNQSVDGVTSSRLTAGTIVGPLTSFQPSTYIANSSTKGGAGETGVGAGIYGVKFDNDAGARYGWLDVAFSVGGYGVPYDARINSWGYEDTGAQIAAGALTAVPTPGTLPMMALGLIGLAASRRRQRSAQARQSH